MLARDGTELLYVPVMNYGDGDFELTKEMLAHPLSVPGLGDAGAHVGFLCDGSMPSFLLSHWGRNRTRGETLPVEQLIEMAVRRHCGLWSDSTTGAPWRTVNGPTSISLTSTSSNCEP